MAQERTHNLNLTLKGYPKKFWGLFGQKAHQRQQITLFHPPKEGLSLTPMSQAQTYNPKCKRKRLPSKTLRFSWDGSAHSAHNTANFPDWLVSQEWAFSLVTMLMSISQSLYNFSQQEFHHRHSSHIYIYIYICVSHISHFVGKSSSVQF